MERSVLKANQILGMLKRTFVHWDSKTFLKHCTAFVRPHLEYCTAAWNQHLKKDIAKLEGSNKTLKL